MHPLAKDSSGMLVSVLLLGSAFITPYGKLLLWHGEASSFGYFWLNGKIFQFLNTIIKRCLK